MTFVRLADCKEIIYYYFSFIFRVIIFYAPTPSLLSNIHTILVLNGNVFYYTYGAITMLK
jgi:hypothetical protein